MKIKCKKCRANVKIVPSLKEKKENNEVEDYSYIYVKNYEPISLCCDQGHFFNYYIKFVDEKETAS